MSEKGPKKRNPLAREGKIPDATKKLLAGKSREVAPAARTDTLQEMSNRLKVGITQLGVQLRTKIAGMTQPDARLSEVRVEVLAIKITLDQLVTQLRSHTNNPALLTYLESVQKTSAELDNKLIGDKESLIEALDILQEQLTALVEYLQHPKT